jgi:DNA (cytosine-5)-methyltransferase 1
MSDKIIIAGRLNVNGWHNKACEILNTGGVSTCIHCQSNNLLQKIIIESDMEKEKKQIELPAELQGKKFRIRKLTPKECFRLMGVDDADIDKIQASGISNSGQYKLAGNSIVVDVLFHLFRKMFIETEPEEVRGEPKQLSLF